MTTNKNEWEKVDTNPVHNFEKEPELIGYFVDIETEVGENNSNLYTVRKEDGELISFWGSTVIDTRMKNIMPDEMVKIVYLGKTKSQKSNRVFKNFEIYHKKADMELPKEDAKTAEPSKEDLEQIGF